MEQIERAKKNTNLFPGTVMLLALMEQIERDKQETNLFLINTIKQLALIVLAPLLAIAVWFVVSGQGQTYTNVAILAALNLAIGLVTKEVVYGLIKFAQ